MSPSSIRHEDFEGRIVQAASTEFEWLYKSGSSHAQTAAADHCSFTMALLPSVEDRVIKEA
jgi:hypothetical protein